MLKIKCFLKDVKIKKLHWVEDSFGNLHSETPIGREFIQRWEYTGGSEPFFEFEGNKFKTVDAAKKAAQDDFEKRVRGALE